MGEINRSTRKGCFMVLALTKEGFLSDFQQWNEQIALELAKNHNVILTPAHWEIIWFMRGFYEKFDYLPNMRVFVKAIAKELGDEKGNSRYLHGLFPQSPLKFACLFAGLPKPPTCL